MNPNPRGLNPCASAPIRVLFYFWGLTLKIEKCIFRYILGRDRQEYGTDWRPGRDTDDGDDKGRGASLRDVCT